MEDILRENQRLQKMVKDKDTEIEHLKREKQEYMSEAEDLKAKLVSLQKLALPTRSSSPRKKGPPNSSFAKSPVRPSSPEKKQQPVSIFANLPARPVFTGFNTPAGIPAPQPSFFAPMPSQQILPPRSTPYTAGIKPTTIPPTLPARPERRPKGTVPPLLPHHQSFGTSQIAMPDLAPEPVFHDFAQLPLNLSPLEIDQQSGGAWFENTLHEAVHYPAGNEREDNEWPIAQQFDENLRWR